MFPAFKPLPKVFLSGPTRHTATASGRPFFYLDRPSYRFYLPGKSGTSPCKSGQLEKDLELEVSSARHAAPLIIFEIMRSFFVGFKCSSRSLTFWICDACSFKVAVKALSSLAC